MKKLRSIYLLIFLLLFISKTNLVASQVYTFDAEAMNYERFKNSPCFEKLGFSPMWDMKDLEQRYNECEGEHNLKKGTGYFFLIMFGTVIVVVIYLSNSKKSKNKISTN